MLFFSNLLFLHHLLLIFLIFLSGHSIMRHFASCSCFFNWLITMSVKRWSSQKKDALHLSFFSESSFILASGLVYQSKSNERLFWARALQTSCITKNILTMTQAKKRGTIFCQIPSAHLSPLFPLSENRLINHLLNICHFVK